MGEQPCLWSSLKLEFVLRNAHPTRRMQTLLRVLNLRRLQALQQLTLDFISLPISWHDCIHLLQNIPTSVRKLSLESLYLGKPSLPIHELAEELVAKLVNFEEVDFGFYGFLRDMSNANAILREVTAVASSGENSKLKVFSMPGQFQFSVFGHEPNISHALAEARKVLTVNLLRKLPYRIILVDEVDEDGIEIDTEDDGDEV